MDQPCAKKAPGVYCDLPAFHTGPHSWQHPLVKELRGLLNAAWLLGFFRNCVPGTVGGQLKEEVDAMLKRTAQGE